MRQLKSIKFSRVFAEYLKNGSTDFYLMYVMFRKSSIVSFEIEDWRKVIHCCHGNQFMIEFWVNKSWSKRIKVTFFLRFRTNTAAWVKIWNQKPKITPYTQFLLNLLKNKETMKTFHFFICDDEMTSYFRFRDDVIIFLNFTRFLPIVYSYHVSVSFDLTEKKIKKICLSVFSQALLLKLVTMATIYDLFPSFSFKRWPI